MSNVTLKIKTKSGQFVVNSLQNTNTLNELKEHISSLANIPVQNISLLSGYPPKILECVDPSKTLDEAKIKTGDILIIEEKMDPAPPKKDLTPPPTSASFDQEFVEGGLLMRQVVPADNSCLFTSVGFVLSGKVDTTCGSYMRQLIAEELRANEDKYSEAILGKPHKEYIEWILKPESWGGAIEVAALSNHYGIEIAVIDTISGIINRFGEDKNYDYRAFLIFDGIHYDPVYREPLEETGSVQTLFPRGDEKAYQMAEELANEAKTSKQFTDVNRFTLRCLVCRQQLTGQVQAQQHAQQTGHLNFGEIAS